MHVTICPTRTRPLIRGVTFSTGARLVVGTGGGGGGGTTGTASVAVPALALDADPNAFTTVTVAPSAIPVGRSAMSSDVVPGAAGNTLPFVVRTLIEGASPPGATSR